MTTSQPPFVFDEFFASGKEEAISPFLTPSSHYFSKNLLLKASLLASILLTISFTLRGFNPILSEIMLLMVYFLVGTSALIDSIQDIKNMIINIDVLMTLAALLSVIIGSGYEGALLLVLFALSGAMESSVTQKTKGALSHLNTLAPSQGLVIDPSGEIIARGVKDIKIGNHILVKAGEIVPLDGLVIDGSSFVNLSHLTGESAHIPKGKGDEVQAGARNLDGTLTIEVSRLSADSTLSRIIQLITHAQEAKPKLQKIIDRFGDTYALVIIGLSLLFALSLPWIFPFIPYFGKEGAIYRSLTFLIAASPCALIIATPTAYLSAISSCAKKGILLKGGIILDALASCKSVAFDKTGTLTTGDLVCTSFQCLTSNSDVIEAVGVAASIEQHVVHPIANALIAYAQGSRAPMIKVEGFQAIPGCGIQAQTMYKQNLQPVFIGHYRFVSSQFDPSLKERMTKNPIPKTEEGKVITYMLIGRELFYITFTDQIKSESSALIRSLRDRLNMDVSMLTGDHQDNANAVAKAIGIENIHANLRPEDKLELVAAMAQEQGLIMVGDGVNDAPALMRATVGISMGKIGSATAIDASDVVFLQDNLASLDWLIDKSHKTLFIIKQNLMLALGVILFATSPAILGLVPLWAAVILHEGGTVLVGLNSLRLLRK